MKGSVKPHAFSWFIWGILMTVIFFAQTVKGGGAGAWAIGLSAVVSLAIAAISMFKGEKEITTFDKEILLLALFGIVAWAVTTDPVWSVIILTIVDAIGFIPTFRKAYKKPYEESITVYGLSGLSKTVSVFALAAVNITTVLYPVSLIITVVP